MTDRRPAQRVLVLCTANSARSQMAEGLLRHDSGGRIEVASAGTRPGQVRPEAVEVMAEIGIDIGGQRSKSVEQVLEQPFDVVLTVCDHAAESCPVFPGDGRRLHHGFSDPAAVRGSQAEVLAAFRRVRDELRVYLDRLIDQLTDASPPR
jgi:arsenate reductase